MDKPELIKRVYSEDLDAILGKSFPVLNDGFVRAVDYMGGDASIVQAARVSYGIGTKKVSEDKGLIRYLLRHRHTTPFEMANLKLHIRVPMDTWRQWVRHRTASINEYSTRYSVAIDEKQTTRPDEWRLQATDNKQGSDGFLDEIVGKKLSEAEKILHWNAKNVYEERLSQGVAREQARKDLPLSTYTEAYWSMNLHNLLHFLALRMDSHAQKEIRDYANIIGNEIVAKWVPQTWEAFKDYRLNASGLTGLEIPIIQALNNNDLETVNQLAESYGWLKHTKGQLINNRERQEAENKLENLGFKIPWK